MIWAIIFDLFGTLVRETPRSAFHDVLAEMALALGAPADVFVDAWSASAVERQTGMLGDIEGNVRAICNRIGIRAEDQAVATAISVRAALYNRWFVPKDGAEETLSDLRRRGYRTGLISMCAPDAPDLWRATPLAQLVDVAVFSSETGLRKPDPEMYLTATRALGVEPEACVYVGDGAYGELSGAERLGMRAVLVRDPEEAGALRPEAEADVWRGATIRSLWEVGALVPVAPAAGSTQAQGRGRRP